MNLEEFSSKCGSVWVENNDLAERSFVMSSTWWSEETKPMKPSLRVWCKYEWQDGMFHRQKHHFLTDTTKNGLELNLSGPSPPVTQKRIPKWIICQMEPLKYAPKTRNKTGFTVVQINRSLTKFTLTRLCLWATSEIVPKCLLAFFCFYFFTLLHKSKANAPRVSQNFYS